MSFFSFIPVSFAAPWLLLSLLVLPVIWWLLRVTPPSPKRVRFPAIRLLLGLSPDEETPAHTPLWLMMLRLLVAALVIFALADPLLNPSPRFAGSGPLLVVVDDGWPAAARWRDRQDMLEGIVAEAKRNDRPVLITGTAPRVTAPELTFQTPGQTLSLIHTWEPQPLPSDRTALIARLQSAIKPQKNPPEVIWLSDGVDNGDAADFAAGLGHMARDHAISIYEPRTDEPAQGLLPPGIEDGRFSATIIRPGTSGKIKGSVRALGDDGRVITQQPYEIAAGSDRGNISIALPLELRNQVARLEIAGEHSAGSVALLDGRWRRRTVGLVSGGAGEDTQPLLSDLYFLRRAIGPYAEIIKPDAKKGEGDVSALLAHPLSILVLADVGTLSTPDRDAVAAWVDNGGLLIRFAGSRLAAQSDDLIPVPLRNGGRAMGGALSWTTPQKLSPFDQQSPFYGLKIPDDVTVNRQVLAEPAADLPGHIWARLQDGTPLVTAARRGKGLIVLFHVTANVQWSNLPYSGLYVEMLQRIIDEAGTAATDGTQADAARSAMRESSLAPVRTLDGAGALELPPVTVLPISRAAFDQGIIDVRHPPGLYGPASAPRALNSLKPGQSLAPIGALSGIASRETYAQRAEIRLAPWAYAIAFLLLLIDTLATFYITGRFETPRIARPARFIRRRLGRGPPLMLLAGFLLGVSGHMSPVRADDSFAIRASHDTHLAYVITGDASVDMVSEEGLQGLGNVLRDRTALEPGEPMGVDLDRDDLAFFPIVYWPMSANAPDPSPAAIAKIDSYMKNGGLVLFDTRDQNSAVPGIESPEAAHLKRILTKLDVPTLTPVPEGHVLGRSFYLMQNWPGRFDGGTLWVEASAGAGDGRANDGVSSIIIGSGDFAGAWAVDKSGQPIFPCVPGGEMQREYAYRFGVNLVMYALTGNYKADQVHVPALLDRLGQ